MSVNIWVEVEGVKKLVEALREKYPEAVGKVVAEALETVAQRIWQDALRFVPVRTGYLRSSIYWLPIGEYSFAVGARAPYALYVEFGTRRMAPRLFLTRAIQLHRDEVKEEVEKGLEEALKVFK